MPVALEVCVTSLKDAIAAERAGAARIELCSSLEAGGLTPSHGLMKAVIEAIEIPVHVLIRPRSGDFVYDHDECEIIRADIDAAVALGCDGIVIGILDEQRRINIDALTSFIQRNSNIVVTFHRAFDDLVDQSQGLEDILNATNRCARILTSGGRHSAYDPTARQQLKRLIELADDRIIIMPGAGITTENVRSIVEETGAKEVHASCKREIGVEKEGKSLFAAARWETDEDTVVQMVKLLKE